MKTLTKFSVLKIISVFICIVIVLVLADTLGFLWHPKMNAEKMLKRIDKVGGLNELNQESKIIFNRLGTNEWRFLYPDDLKDCPAISALGNTFGYYPEGADEIQDSRDFPKHIWIRYGSHFYSKSIFIFQTEPEMLRATNLINAPFVFQVSSNILATK
jgi:hypothetical protein